MRISKLVLSTLLAVGLFAAAGTSLASSAKNDIAKALANPARSADDRERDARDKPQDVLAFAGFHRGQTIADVFGGAGYYTEILAGVVGPKGKVRDVNNPVYDGYAKEGAAKRFADNRLPNASYEVAPTEAMKLGHASLDGALLVMAYHDLYVSHPDRGWPATDVSQFVGQLADALKPGAKVLVVDHEARAGSGHQDTQELHRIDEQQVIADFKAHGLELAGTLPVLRNPADPRDKNVFDPSIRGKTDRFVFLFRKR